MIFSADLANFSSQRRVSPNTSFCQFDEIVLESCGISSETVVISGHLQTSAKFSGIFSLFLFLFFSFFFAATGWEAIRNLTKDRVEKNTF